MDEYIKVSVNFFGNNKEIWLGKKLRISDYLQAEDIFENDKLKVEINGLETDNY